MLKKINLQSLMLLNAKRGWGANKRSPANLHSNFVKDIYRLDHDAAIEAVRAHVRNGMANELEALSNA